MVNLQRAFELDNGIISDGVVIPSSIFEQTRSCAVNYSGSNVATVVYYNSLSQINANRIADITLTYSNDFVTQEILRYYGQDGTTVFLTETHTHIYSGDNLIRTEVTSA